MAAKEKEEAKDEKGAEGAAEAPPKKSKKMLFIILAVVLLLGGGGGAFVMLGGEKKEETPAEEVHEEKELGTAPLDVFIVNLSENQSFLKIRMLLEYDATAVHHFEEELAKKGGAGGGGGHEAKGEGLSGYLATREPMIRDAVIHVLSTKRAAEVLSLEGKNKLKEELIEAINEAIAMDEAPVEQIYFNEFIIQ